MSYEKYEWKDGDIITAEKLNHLETGLATADPTYTAHTWADGDIITEALFDALEAGIAALNVNYSRHDWATGEEITVAKLNHMEDGIYLGSVTLKTVFYTDGTLIINEDPADRTANVTAHGAVDTEYPALDKEHDYVFSVGMSGPTTYWFSKAESVTGVEIGTEVRPTSMAFWFIGMNNCTGMLLEELNTSAVTNMNGMFNNCPALTTIDVSGFDTSAVTDMSNMFNACSALTTLDVSGFDTSAVANMSGMFTGCTGLTTIEASNDFVVASGANTTSMFAGCTNLVGGNGTAYSAEHTDGTYARIDTAATPGYFTAAA